MLRVVVVLAFRLRARLSRRGAGPAQQPDRHELPVRRVTQLTGPCFNWACLSHHAPVDAHVTIRGMAAPRAGDMRHVVYARIGDEAYTRTDRVAALRKSAGHAEGIWERDVAFTSDGGRRGR